MATTPPAHTTGTEVAGEPHEGAFPPFDAGNFAPQLVWLAITFGVLYWLMAKVALPRVAGILQMRESKISGDLDAAAARKTEADAAAAAHDRTLADARTRAIALAQETHAKLTTETEAKRHALEADLNAKLAVSEAEIAAMKTRAMGNVAEIARDTASAIVQQLSGRTPDAQAIAAAVASAKA